MDDFAKTLPKLELHAHLNGSLSTEPLKKLGCFDESIGEYKKLNNLRETNPRTLDECFELFKVAHDATKTKEAVYIATKDVIREFYEDNVVYLELRTTPRAEKGMTKQEYIETVIQAIEDRKENILVKLILSIDRRHDVATSEEVLNLIIDMKNKFPAIIKGIDLCGNPNVGVFSNKLFKKARENGLYITLHCAEVKNDKEVKDMLNLKPERIGHGTCIHPNFGGNEEIWNLFCKNRIPTECCLTSNVLCGVSETYGKHHLVEIIKNKLPFTISTDDKGVFNTTLTEELLKTKQHFKLRDDDLWTISYNSVCQSFANAEEKNNLKNMLFTWKAKHNP